MVMFRDWGVCWLLSVGFEVLECSLQFIIPEFKECWWDSLLIDLLGANMLGMAAGWLTLQVRAKNKEETEIDILILQKEDLYKYLCAHMRASAYLHRSTYAFNYLGALCLGYRDRLSMRA